MDTFIEDHPFISMLAFIMLAFILHHFCPMSDEEAELRQETRTGVYPDCFVNNPGRTN